MAVKPTTSEFTFIEAGENAYKVECNNKLIGYVGEASCGKWTCSVQGWKSQHFGDRDVQVYTHSKSSPVFLNKEDAAKALYYIQETISETPLTPDLRRYFIEEARRLKERKEGLLSELSALDRQRGWLSHFAKQYGLELDFEGDMKKEIEKLIKFLDENVDSLYDQMGKDFARSLRAYVANVVSIVDPSIAERI